MPKISQIQHGILLLCQKNQSPQAVFNLYNIHLAIALAATQVILPQIALGLVIVLGGRPASLADPE